MIVYRVENSNGHGPYNAATNPDADEEENEFLEDLYERHSDFLDKENHPAWHTDGIYDYIPLEHRAGFPSIRQIIRWFDKYERKQLERFGFVVNKYKVNKQFVIIGDSGKQVAFVKHRAELVRTLNFSDIKGVKYERKDCLSY